MNFRLATENDLEEICSLIKEAIIEMEKKKIFQWDEISVSSARRGAQAYCQTAAAVSCSRC